MFILNISPLIKSFKLLRCKYCTMVKVLNVAEKNDAAKSIAELMSVGRYRRREGMSKYNKIYEFDYNLMNQNVTMVMTSVSGHLLNNDFSGQYKHWNSCSPVTLFDAPVEKFCPQNFVDIKKTLEREVRGCDSLVIWTDGDREGENIGYEIIDVCKAVKRNLKVYRARFSEITREAIRRAVNNLAPPDKRVSDAVDVRMELDLRIGAAFTRFQTLRLKRVFPEVLADQLISYGSCQFPTLGFVVERYKQVQAFIPEPFWKIKALVVTLFCVFPVTLDTEEGMCEFAWKRHRLFDHLACLVIYEHIIESPVARVLSVTSKPKSKWRPVALDTVELEKLASRKLRINAKETMKIAEKLYTQGFISYPRTETNIFPKDLDLVNLVQQQTQHPNWGGFASNLLQNGPRPRNGNKSDKAHPPIHPTKYTNGLQGNEARLYEFIVRHFLACCSEDAKGQETTVEICVNEEYFTASGLMILARNYLDVYPYDKWNAKVIPTFTQGDEFEPSSVEMNQSETSPPSLLTEADLIALMDKHGIGTDATHAEHIETIKSRLYVGVRDDGKFVPGELGMGLVEGYDLMGYEMSKPHLRAELEADLKRICEGTRDKDVVLREQVSKYREVFVEALRQAKKIDEALSQYFGAAMEAGNEVENTYQPSVSVMSCQKCGSHMVIKRKKDGKGLYLSCMGFPQCKNAVWFPDAVLEANASDSYCTSCAAGSVRKVRFKFKKGGVPPYIPLEYEGCVACDSTLKDIFNMPSFSSRQSNTATNNAATSQSSHSVPSKASYHGNHGGGTGNSNQTNSKQQRSYSTSSVSRTSTQNNNVSQTGIQSMAYQDSGYGTSSDGASSLENSNTIRNSGKNWPAGNSQESFSAKNQNSWNKNTNTGRGSLSGNGGRTAGFLSPLKGASAGGSSLRNRDNNVNISNSFGASSEGNEIVCNCNEDAKMFTVKKSGPNCGRQFYTCSKPPDAKCGFFLWADQSSDHTQGHGASGYSVSNQGNSRGYGSSSHSSPARYGGVANDNRAGGDADACRCNCRLDAKLLTVQKEGPNKGRPFYSCPKPPQESKCNFFQWADQSDQENQRPFGGTSSFNRSSYNPTGSSDVKCNCDVSAKQLTVQKEGPNKGRHFYGCPKPREQGCGFFQWADEDTGGNSGRAEASYKRKPSAVSDHGGNNPVKKKRKCGVCQQEGHNKKNCPQNR